MTKKWTSALLASSLVFSTIGATTVANDANAKESTKVETAAAAKKTLLWGLKGGETRAQIEKMAKKKGWKDTQDTGYNSVAYYIPGKFYNQSKTVIHFYFNNNKKRTLTNINYYFNVMDEKKDNPKKRYTTMYKKMNTDLGKKGKQMTYNDEEINFIERYATWKIKKTNITFSAQKYKSIISIDF